MLRITSGQKTNNNLGDFHLGDYYFRGWIDLGAESRAEILRALYRILYIRYPVKFYDSKVQV